MKDGRIFKKRDRDVALLKLVGMKLINVHGGGKEISKWAQGVRKGTRIYHGLCVTDKETMGQLKWYYREVNQKLKNMMAEVGRKSQVWKKMLK